MHSKSSHEDPRLEQIIFECSVNVCVEKCIIKYVESSLLPLM